MKKLLGISFLIIPFSMMLNVHQSKNYARTKTEINNLLREQNQLLQENQSVIAEIARNSAPTIIEHLAQSRGAALEKIQPQQILRIFIPKEDLSP